MRAAPRARVRYTPCMNLGLMLLGIAGLALGLWVGVKVRGALEAEGEASPSGRLYKKAKKWALRRLWDRGGGEG